MEYSIIIIVSYLNIIFTFGGHQWNKPLLLYQLINSDTNSLAKFIEWARLEDIHFLKI